MAKLQRVTTFARDYRCISGLTRGRALRIARTVGATQRMWTDEGVTASITLQDKAGHVYARVFKDIRDGRWTIHYVFMGGTRRVR